MLIVYEGKSLETSKTSFGSKTEEVVGRSLESDDNYEEFEDDDEGSDTESARKTSCSRNSSWKKNWNKNDTLAENVTMKMIDFAHSTFEGFMDDPIIHEGPDSGYIKGLDSLVTILQNALYNAP